MIAYNGFLSGLTKVHYDGHDLSMVYLGNHKVYPNSTPPTPYHFKAQYTNVDSTTGEVACNSSSILTYTDFTNTLNLLHITVGECVDGFDTHLVDVNYRSLRTIDLTHSNITTVPKNFMNGVSTLRNAYLNDSTTTISQTAFSGCTSLSAITIPSSVTSIGLNAFRESGLREITYYNGITYGAYVYYSCSSASALTIEQGTTRIEQGTFASCSGLTSLTIPSSVAYIGTQAFILCTSLSSITVNATTPPVLGDSVFAMTNDCPILVPCEAIENYRTEWAEYASRLQCIQPSYDNRYLTFKIKSNGSKFKFSGNTINYSLDSGSTWTSLTSNTYTPTLNSGDTIMWKGSNMTVKENKGIGCFTTDGVIYSYDVEGNIMSLIYGDDFATATTISPYQFMGLFYNCDIEGQDITLPATTLKNYCYYQMFDGCDKMTSTPELPATTLADYCYYEMFSACKSITTAPELPATTLASHCYTNMFGACTSLTTAPELPASTMVDSCYSSMFRSCTSLTTAPTLSAMTLASSCYSSMFQGCTSLTTAPALPATDISGTTACYSLMFKGCTSLTTAPDLLATALGSYSYNQMFNGCTSLNYIKMMATTPIGVVSPLIDWVKDVSPTGTFVKDASMTLPSGDSGIPNGWTVQEIPSYQWVSYASGDTVPTATTVYGVRIYPLYDSSYNVTFSGSNGDYIRLYPDGFSDWVAVDENGASIDISSYRIRPGYTEYEIPFSDLGMGGMNIISPTTIFKDDIDLYIPNS